MNREPAHIIGKSSGQDNYPNPNPYPQPRNPNGWYGLLRSSDLPKDKVVNLHYFGREILAFRDKDGKPSVVDAYCAHFGAHMGKPGKVVNGEIQCPFHGWRFDGEGKCTAAPFGKKTPSSDRSRIKTYVTVERNDMILVWYHINDEGPTYEIPEFEQSDLSKWTKTDSFSLKFRVHVQELRENFFDETHFVYTHEQPTPPEVSFEEDGPFSTHKVNIKLKELEILGLKSDYWTFLSDSVLYGPGVINIHMKGVFHVTTVGYCNPIDDEFSELRIVISAKKFKYVPFLAHMFRRLGMKLGIKQISHEGEVWTNKLYKQQPLFLAHERSTPAFRRWYTQFYDGHELPNNWYGEFLQQSRNEINKKETLKSEEKYISEEKTCA